MQSGDLKVVNHTTKEECHVKYHAYSYFSREKQKRVSQFLIARGSPRLLEGVAKEVTLCSHFRLLG